MGQAWDRLRRRAIILALGLAVIGTASASGANTGALTFVDSQFYAHPAQLTAVDGKRRLNLLCMGSGSPVVMLEAGAGDSTEIWRKVQGEIAKFTRVCAYDRAGYGYSDPISRPSDARNIVADLHALLDGAGLRAPIVLVGHSVGGLYTQLFTATYPDRVAGAVLVDPTGLDDFRIVTTIITDEERQQQRAGYLKRMASYALCVDRARRGIPPDPGSDCAPYITGDAVLDDAAKRQYADPKYFEAYQSEMTNFWPPNHPMGTDSVITSQVRDHPVSFGDRPVILLKTPGRVPPGERGVRLTAESLAVAQRLAATSTRGRVIQVTSGHYIHLEHPDVVIGAVREVVDDVRASPDH